MRGRTTLLLLNYFRLWDRYAVELALSNYHATLFIHKHHYAYTTSTSSIFSLLICLLIRHRISASAHNAPFLVTEKKLPQLDYHSSLPHTLVYVCLGRKRAASRLNCCLETWGLRRLIERKVMCLDEFRVLILSWKTPGFWWRSLWQIT